MTTQTRAELGRLLPCPFCGGEAKCSDPIPMGIGYPRFRINCTQCDVMYARDGYATAGIAITRWNSRAVLAQEAAGDGVKESDEGHGCKRSGGFVDSNCMALCDCHLTMKLSRPSEPTPAVVAEPEAWDHRVFCACESCTDNDPEAAVHVREDIGVMPDGTWLCADCYRECDNREYGMSPNDLDDFEYPSFADLPRPQSAKPASQALPGREAREVERLKALSDLSIRRMAEMAEPGFIGAFGARDIAVARALAAEARLSSIEAETRADEREACARVARFWEVFSAGERKVASGIATAIRNREA